MNVDPPYVIAALSQSALSQNSALRSTLLQKQSTGIAAGPLCKVPPCFKSAVKIPVHKTSSVKLCLSNLAMLSAVLRLAHYWTASPVQVWKKH